jgi:hypothetical protein
MFADFNHFLFEPAQTFVREVEKLSDLDFLLTRLSNLQDLRNDKPAPPRRQQIPGSFKATAPTLLKLTKKSSDRTTSTQCVSQKPRRLFPQADCRALVRRSWKEVAASGVAIDQKTASSAKNTVKFIRGKPLTVPVIAKVSKSIDFLHNFFKNKSFAKTDSESTGTKFGSSHKRLFFAEDGKAGKNMPSFCPSAMTDMPTVPEAEYELSSYDEREGNSGFGKKLVTCNQLLPSSKASGHLKKPIWGKQSQPEGRENTEQCNRGGRWTPSSDSNSSVGFFMPPSSQTTEINGKKIPDWAQDLEAVRAQNLIDKANNRHLEVFGRIDTKQRVPLALIFGSTSIFLELPSEGEDWSEDDWPAPPHP